MVTVRFFIDGEFVRDGKFDEPPTPTASYIFNNCRYGVVSREQITIDAYKYHLAEGNPNVFKLEDEPHQEQRDLEFYFY